MIPTAAMAVMRNTSAARLNTVAEANDFPARARLGGGALLASSVSGTWVAIIFASYAGYFTGQDDDQSAACVWRDAVRCPVGLLIVQHR